MTTLKPPAPFGLDIDAMDPYAREFWRRVNDEVLPYQRCGACGAAEFPPNDWCRSCLQDALVWETSAGRGRLESWSVVWRPVNPSFEVPYATAVVELDEGFRMVTCIVGDDSGLRAGAVVSVEFAGDSTQRIPVFRLEDR